MFRTIHLHMRIKRHEPRYVYLPISRRNTHIRSSDTIVYLFTLHNVFEEYTHALRIKYPAGGADIHRFAFASLFLFLCALPSQDILSATKISFVTSCLMCTLPCYYTTTLAHIVCIKHHVQMVVVASIPCIMYTMTPRTSCVLQGRGAFLVYDVYLRHY